MSVPSRTAHRKQIGCASRVKRLRAATLYQVNYPLKTETLKAAKVVATGVRGCVRYSRTRDAIRYIARVFSCFVLHLKKKRKLKYF